MTETDDSRRWERIKELFSAALDRDPEDRSAFLDQACRGDEPLRSELEAMLEAQTGENDFMETPIVLDAPVEEPGTIPAGTRIGRFIIQNVISSGGMGVVYEALQEKPRRTVAVKVMKSGIMSQQILRRFEYESQILARLEHPGIAQVIEAGTHEEEGGFGLPYFVMEYIPDARPITEYARENELTSRQRLRLFIQACDAVHHGNQKGIIHRDLKPGNILVDARGQVKIIDFGVARATDSDMSLTTIQTDVGLLMGTVPYMSPEQCEADPHDLDIRSDVYTLGVVLYELLCEQLPYDVRRIAVFEAVRVIREEPPKKPSTINRTLRGDMETIVLKALEKDRENRYQTVAELGDDLMRHLRGEVIKAKPAGPAVRLVKLVRRNPVVSAALAAAIVAFVGFSLYTVLVYFPRIREERDKALSAQKETEKEKKAALKAQSTAEKEMAKATRISKYLMETLFSADPLRTAGEFDLLGMLAQAEVRIDSEFPDDPEVRALLRHTLGSIYYGRGVYDASERNLAIAIEIRTRIFGPHHPAVLSSRNCMGLVVEMMGRLDEAETILTTNLEDRCRVLGEENIKTLFSRHALGSLYKRQGRFAEAKELLGRVVESCLQSVGERNSLTLSANQKLASLLSEEGRLDEAEAMLRRIVEIRCQVKGDDHSRTVNSKNNLAIVLIKQGRDAEAVELLREIISNFIRLLGPDHSTTLSARLNISNALRDLGSLDEAEEQLRNVIDTCRRTMLGDDHPLAVSATFNLAGVFSRQGKIVEAEILNRRVLEIREQRLGENHADTITAWFGLAVLLQTQNRLAEAETIYRRVVEKRRELHGENHLDTVKAKSNLAETLDRQGKLADAEPLYRELFDLWRHRHGESHDFTQRTRKRLAILLRRRGSPTEAETLQRELIRQYGMIRGEEHRDTLEAKHDLAITLRVQKRYPEAEILYHEILETRIRVLGREERDTLDAMNNLANFFLITGNLKEAEPLLKEGITLAQHALPQDDEVAAMLHTTYGEVLLEEKRYADAEKHLLLGYQGLASSMGEGNKYTRAVCGILISLYEAWDRPDRAAEWRSILEETKGAPPEKQTPARNDID